jgi:ribose 5-phosphate isomerase A
MIIENGLTLTDLSRNPVIDIAFDGADEIDDHLNCLKSTGGVHTQEKIVASNAKKWYFFGDASKKSSKLGEKYRGGVAIEVIPMVYVPILNKIRALGAKAELRLAKSKAGPVVTDHGNFIIDADFGTIEEPTKLAQSIISIPGVVEHSLFCGMCVQAYIGNPDGTVTIINSRSSNL